MPQGVYVRTREHLLILKKARDAKKHGPLSEETKSKIGDANRKQIEFICDNCGKSCSDKPSHHARKSSHFCSVECYGAFRKTLPFYKQNSYKGVRKPGESAHIYHKNYCKSAPENIAHLKANRYAREKGAEGSHTLNEWNEVKKFHDNRCAICGEEKKLTKDHIIPLSKGGTNFISNIQPLCGSCNSRKGNKITNQNPSLLEAPNA